MTQYTFESEQMPYLRHRLPPGVKWILIITIGMFILQMLFDRGSANSPSSVGVMTHYLGLWPEQFLHGYVWQLGTYMLLHSNTLILHIFLNMLTLFFIGPETERSMGTRHFLIMYVLSGLLGGLYWVVTSRYGVCVGASGAIFGVLGAMTALFPTRMITLLLFFVIPITMRIWVLAVGLMVLQLGFILLHTGGNVAYGVHVAGGIAGFLYTVKVFRPDLPKIWLHRLRMKGKLKVVPLSGQPDQPAQPDQKVVDNILDKVAVDGITSLSRKEREILEKASEAHRKR